MCDLGKGEGEGVIQVGKGAGACISAGGAQGAGVGAGAGAGGKKKGLCSAEVRMVDIGPEANVAQFDENHEGERLAGWLSF